jgi:hypothetical protein
MLGLRVAAYWHSRVTEMRLNIQEILLFGLIIRTVGPGWCRAGKAARELQMALVDQGEQEEAAIELIVVQNQRKNAGNSLVAGSITSFPLNLYTLFDVASMATCCTAQPIATTL